MALLHVLSRLRSEFGFELLAHGVDHGLRDAASAELDLAESFAASLGVVFQRTRLALSPEAGNVQARAREARHRAFGEVAQEFGAKWLATAHHADDRAETVLLRILRGSSVSGLHVLPPQSRGETVPSGLASIRPLIFARRADINAHVERHGIPFVDDPSNLDARYLRTRVRSELIPMLEDLSPGIVGHLIHLAEQAAPDSVQGVCAELCSRLGLGREQGVALSQVLERPHGGERLKLSGGFDLVVERGSPGSSRPPN
jgi:tRNA(Ile)-lysidine synthase